MISVRLKKHDRNYTEVISQLMSDPLVQHSLGLNWQQVSIYGTRDYIEFIQGEERMGKQLSRVIFNEKDELIGIVTLKAIDRQNKTAHIGTWLGAAYWGKGYNELAKLEMFKIAFEELGLHYVFAGAKKTNIRSLRAQRKLPYLTEDVGNAFPEELLKIEAETGETCVLNVIKKEKFLHYLNELTIV